MVDESADAFVEKCSSRILSLSLYIYIASIAVRVVRP